ncbi:MAG: DUF2259 domain-containing protein [Myxococcales bacterium]|nr:DUF2259 domain-containing protein [Myxococcales bacterium]
MRRLVLLASIAGCGAPDVQPLNEAKRLEPEKSVPKDSKAKTDPKPAPAPPPAPSGPYTRAGDKTTQTDDFTFWGWSSDNSRFAFEVHDHGPGARGCEGSYTLYVVDAAADKFADGTPLKVEHKTKADDDCDPPDLGAEMARLRPAALTQHGIDPANQSPPVVPTPVTTTTGREKSPSWTLLLGGAPVTAELAVLHGGREAAGEPGAAYRLTLRRDKTQKVVEPGTRRRPFVWNYSLDRGLAFVAPDGRHLALFVATTQLSFEGDRHSVMSNGLAVPPEWALTPQN